MLAAGLLAKKAVERGLTPQALGQDQPRARLQGGHRVPRRGRPDRRTSSSSASTSSATAAPPASATRGPLPGGDLEGDRGATTWSCRAVLSGNRNFEGRINSEVQCQLPGLAAAGGGLRAGRAHGHRPARTSRSATDSDGQPVYLRDIWPSQRGGARGHRARRRRSDMFREQLRRRLRGRRALERRSTSPRATRYAWDAGLDLRQAAALLRGHARRAARRLERHPGRARAGAARRQRHHRPHLAGRRDQEGLARPART